MEVAQCHFIRMQSSGFTDFFDVRFSDVSDRSECEELCLKWSGGICRYFTYHRGTRMCYLSHTSPRTLNKNPLQNYDLNLSSGELEDCLHCTFLRFFSYNSNKNFYFCKHVLK